MNFGNPVDYHLSAPVLVVEDSLLIGVLLCFTACYQVSLHLKEVRNVLCFPSLSLLQGLQL